MGGQYILEKKLLRNGYTYAEVEECIGEKSYNIRRRNLNVYKIDINKAFSSRIKEDGVPNRLAVSDSFGYYFSGLFDGEGTIAIFHRKRGEYNEYRLGICLSLRDDDHNVFSYIRKNLGGKIYWFKGHKPTNPSYRWDLQDVKSLAEVIVPLFDKYRLRTKKANEYKLWRRLVLMRYVDTIGGQVPSLLSDRYKKLFMKSLNSIRKARDYKA